MKMKILTLVSSVAILASTHALAQNKTVELGGEDPTIAEKIQNDAQKALETAKEGTKEVYEEIKARFLSDEGTEINYVTFDPRKTAYGMIGKDVLNASNDKVGTIKDIILDSKGNAEMVIIADSDFPGYSGKLVSIDYSLLTMRDSDGDLIAPLTEEIISKVVGFSYDPKDRSESIRIIPEQGISISKLLEGQLIDAQMNTLAEIDNITLKNGHASELIVGFDKILGLGGEKMALPYTEAKLVRVEDGFDFQLSPKQTAQFEVYKKAINN